MRHVPSRSTDSGDQTQSKHWYPPQAAGDRMLTALRTPVHSKIITVHACETQRIFSSVKITPSVSLIFKLEGLGVKVYIILKETHISKSINIKQETTLAAHTYQRRVPACRAQEHFLLI